MMKINLKKTKIMVFQKSARKNAELRFLIDGQIIDVIQEYTYLGTRISSSRNFCVTAHVKISKESPFMPHLAGDDIRISTN